MRPCKASFRQNSLTTYLYTLVSLRLNQIHLNTFSAKEKAAKVDINFHVQRGWLNERIRKLQVMVILRLLIAQVMETACKVNHMDCAGNGIGM